ncbi:MAG TPA: DnaA/Hda family protein [Stellaceae bacterium]|nr:DnaA/Hda family protein [Stellaceae bacterium]
MTQLPIALPHRTAFGREDFLVASSNAEALFWIDRWPAWPSGVLLVHGPQSCGKTHLAHLWRERCGGMIVGPTELAARDVPTLLAAGRKGLAVDDAERAAELQLLHLYNSCREEGTGLLLTARRPPAAWPTALADLRSRLLATLAVEIGAPDDALLAAVLVKHFADRQLRVSAEAIGYLVPRMERSLAAAATLADRLDAAALAAKRPIGVALARDVLAQDAAYRSSSPSKAGVT